MASSNEPRRDPTKPIRPHRPFVLSLVFWIYLGLTALGWLRFGEAIARWSLIRELLPSWTAYYLLVSGLIWGLVGLPLLYGFFRHLPWTRALICVLAAYYPSHYWFERLFLWADKGTQDNAPFMLLLTLLWFGLVFWAFNSMDAKEYFKNYHKG